MTRLAWDGSYGCALSESVSVGGRCATPIFIPNTEGTAAPRV